MRLLFPILLSMMLPLVLLAQEEESGPAAVSVSGSVTTSADVYGSSGDSTWRPRQEAFLGRLVGRINVRLIDQIDLPFEVFLTTEESGYRQPFNQFGASPQFFGWLRVHGGWFSSRLSDMSYGDTRLLGGGIEATPGSLRLAAFYGYSELARRPDSVNFFAGSFRRRIAALKLGAGAESETYGSINVLHAVDDTSSIRLERYREDTTFYSIPTPKENLLATVNFGFAPVKEVRFDAEIGASAYSEDIGAPVLDDQPLPESFFATRSSSFFDLAAKAGITIRPVPIFAMRLNGEWIGPGYRTLGYPQLQSDVMQFSASPSLRLLDNRLFLSGTLGFRTNNLRGQKLEPTTRLIAALNTSAQITDALGFDASYSSYSFKSEHRNDTLRMNNVFNSITLGPRVTFAGLGGQNTVNVGWSFQTTEDLNPITSQGVMDVHTLTAIHALSLESGWTFGTTGFYTVNDGSTFSNAILSLGESVSRTFIEGKLVLTAAGTVSLVSATFAPPDAPNATQESDDTQFMLRSTGSWQINDWLAAGLQLSLNSYDAGNPARPSFTETTGGLSLTTSW